jgi:hypothetical protein
MAPSMNGTNGGGSPVGGLVNSVMGWFQHPFMTSGSAFNWFLFVGLLIVISWLWHVILLKLTEEI